MRLILSHTPIERETGSPTGSMEDDKMMNREETKEKTKEDFNVRAQSQKELNELTEVCFKGKSIINCEDFGYIIDHIDSAMFLCLLSLLKTHFPALMELKRYEVALKKGNDELMESPKTGRRVAPAKVLSRFSSVSQISRCSTPDPMKAGLRRESDAPSSKLKEAQKVKLGIELKAKSFTNSPLLPAVRLANAKQDSVDVTKSPTTSLSGTVRCEQLLFCQCGKQITNFDKLQCSSCIKKELNMRHEGCLFKRTKKSSKLVKFWYVAEKLEIYRMN